MQITFLEAKPPVPFFPNEGFAEPSNVWYVPGPGVSLKVSRNRLDFEVNPFLSSELFITYVWYFVGIEQNAAVAECGWWRLPRIGFDSPILNVATVTVCNTWSKHICRKPLVESCLMTYPYSIERFWPTTGLRILVLFTLRCLMNRIDEHS